MPLVTVIMPAYNAAKYVQQAVDSILAQSLEDFELIVINDGSTDNTAALLAAVGDPRVRVVHNDGNRGLIYSRNLGVDLATGQFIAFLDSDDVAFPDRLRKQYDYLAAHPDTTAVGSWAQPMDAAGNYQGFLWRYPGDSDFIKATLLFRAYINTSTFFIRAAAMKQLKFSGDHELAEDYDMYQRCVRQYKVVNLQEALIACRVHAESVTRTKVALLTQNLNEIGRRLLRELGIEPSAAELQLHRYVEWLGKSADPDILPASKAWLDKIVAANLDRRVYAPQAMHQAVAERWFSICYSNKHLGLRALRHYCKGPIAPAGVITVQQYMKFLILTVMNTFRSH